MFRQIKFNLFFTMVVALASFLLPSWASAVSFSFTSYSGPSSMRSEMDDYNLGISGGYINDELLPVPVESAYVLTSQLLDDDGVLWKTFVAYCDDFGFEDEPSSLSFRIGTSPYVLINTFTFSPAESTEFAVGVPFLLGTLNFNNETWFTEPLGSAFSFTIIASSTVAGLNDQEFSGTLRLFTNSNNLATAEERADWFFIEERPELGSVRIFERADGSNTGSIEFWGEFGSLDLVEFRNPTGGVFLSSSTNSDPSAAPVPEPATMLLLGVGIAGLGAFRIRQRKK